MNTERVECIKTDGYAFSLVLNAEYQTLRDVVAEQHQMIRIIDESGEDYLYPASYFVPVSVPATMKNRELSHLA